MSMWKFTSDGCLLVGLLLVIAVWMTRAKYVRTRCNCIDRIVCVLYLMVTKLFIWTEIMNRFRMKSESSTQQSTLIDLLQPRSSYYEAIILHARDRCVVSTSIHRSVALWWCVNCSSYTCITLCSRYRYPVK